MIDHREDRDGRDIAAEPRAAAASHEPDRAAVPARVTAGMEAGDRRRTGRTGRGERAGDGPRQWTRVAGPVAGRAAAVAVAGIAVVATDTAGPPQTVRTSSRPAVGPAGAGEHLDRTAKGPGTGSGTASGDGSDRGSQGGAERHTPTAYPTAVGPNHLADPTVRAKGAINSHWHRHWAQSESILTTGEPLTSLTVEPRVARPGAYGPPGPGARCPPAP
ncbi:hypothetical protein ABZS71_18100 [Streptomyces sp. NPDC005393]|uniref:hypothetical protein n=1 Tax=Streptomyces sp. NPDC005393 TaxID=3157041 RepID=UPI0033A5A4A2